MYPFYNNNVTPGFPPFLFPFPAQRRTRLCTLDKNGIYEVYTTGIIETADTDVTYGINANIWRSLPNECIILWKVKHPVTAASAALPVALAVPVGSSSSTVSSTPSNTTSNTKKISVVDNKSTQVVGSDVTNAGTTTEHLVYINKCSDTFKLLGVTAAAAAPAA